MPPWRACATRSSTSCWPTAACPGSAAWRLLTAARKRHPRTVRLLMTGHADMRGAAASLNEAGIFRFLAKPWGAPELRQAIAEALVQRARLLDAGRALPADGAADDLSIRRRLGGDDLRKLATA